MHQISKAMHSDNVSVLTSVFRKEIRKKTATNFYLNVTTTTTVRIFVLLFCFYVCLFFVLLKRMSAFVQPQSVYVYVSILARGHVFPHERVALQQRVTNLVNLKLLKKLFSGSLDI